jgi:uncharacterized protein (DUF1330 family)
MAPRPLRVARRLWSLYQRPLPTPIDVPNLLRLRDPDRYRWYGLAAAPMLRAAGGKVRWAGVLEEALVGEPRAEELLIVRYPSHRSFYRMIATPWYAVANRAWRAPAVARMEGSFTHPERPFERLGKERWIVAAHHHGARPALVEILEGRGGRLAYATTRVAEILGDARPRAASDPQPLAHDLLTFIAFDDPEAAREAVTPASSSLRTVCGDDLVLSLYRRVPLSSFSPFGPKVRPV